MESLPTVVGLQHVDGHRTGCLRSCGQTESLLAVHAMCAGLTGHCHTKCWCVPPERTINSRFGKRPVSSVPVNRFTRRWRRAVSRQCLRWTRAILVGDRRGCDSSTAAYQSGSLARLGGAPCCLSCNYNLSETRTTRKPTPPNPLLRRRCRRCRLSSCPAVIEFALVRTNFARLSPAQPTVGPDCRALGHSAHHTRVRR